MNAKRGYYSLVQYCPDHSRDEAANIGVILFVPEVGSLEVRLTKNNKMIRKFFDRQSYDPTMVDAEKKSLQRRLENEKHSFRTIEDLNQFAQTRANQIRLTLARPTKVFDAAEDLKNLFNELVGSRESTSKKKHPIPALEQAFRPLIEKRIIQEDVEVDVPITGGRFIADYAYRNGKLNYIKPLQLSENRVIERAERLAAEGKLIQEPSTPDEPGSRVIVIPTLRDSKTSRVDRSTIEGLFDFFGMRTVWDEHIHEFIEEVKRTAH